MSYAEKILEKFNRLGLYEANKADFKEYCNSILKEIQDLHLFVFDPEEKPKYTIGSHQACTLFFIQVVEDKDIQACYHEIQSICFDLIRFLNLTDMSITQNRGIPTLPISCSGTKDGYTYDVYCKHEVFPNKEKKVNSVSLNVNITIKAKRLSSSSSFTDFPEVTPGTIYKAGMSGFYQVVRRSGNTVYLQPINSSNGQPMPDDFRSDTVTRRVLKMPNEIEIGRGRIGYRWDMDTQSYYR